MPRTSCVLVALLLCASSPDFAAACDCVVLPTCATTWDADLVFVGTATKVSEPSARVEETEFAVEEWLRGEQVDAKITLRSEGVGFSCDYDFTPGVKYLVIARRRRGLDCGPVWRDASVSKCRLSRQRDPQRASLSSARHCLG